MAPDRRSPRGMKKALAALVRKHVMSPPVTLKTMVHVKLEADEHPYFILRVNYETTTFQKMLLVIAKRLEIDANTIAFIYEGNFVNPSSMASQLGAFRETFSVELVPK
jgi:hypothetical protein